MQNSRPSLATVVGTSTGLSGSGTEGWSGFTNDYNAITGGYYGQIATRSTAVIGVTDPYAINRNVPDGNMLTMSFLVYEAT